MVLLWILAIAKATDAQYCKQLQACATKDICHGDCDMSFLQMDMVMRGRHWLLGRDL